MEVLTIRQLQMTARGRRIELGLSQEALAAKAGVSRKWVSSFERGKASTELPFVLRLLTALELRLDVNPAESSDRQLNPAAESNSGTVDLAALLDRYLET